MDNGSRRADIRDSHAGGPGNPLPGLRSNKRVCRPTGFRRPALGITWPTPVSLLFSEVSPVTARQALQVQPGVVAQIDINRSVVLLPERLILTFACFDIRRR